MSTISGGDSGSSRGAKFSLRRTTHHPSANADSGWLAEIVIDAPETRGMATALVHRDFASHRGLPYRGLAIATSAALIARKQLIKMPFLARRGRSATALNNRLNPLPLSQLDFLTVDCLGHRRAKKIVDLHNIAR